MTEAKDRTSDIELAKPEVEHKDEKQEVPDEETELNKSSCKDLTSCWQFLSANTDD